MSNGLPGPTKLELFMQRLTQSEAVPSHRGPCNGRSSKYAPRKTRPRHRMAVMLHEAGWSNKDIADALGYTQTRVCIILASKNPELQEVRANFAKTVAENITDVQLRFKLYANEALTRMVDHMRQTENAQVSRLAAKDILDRAGYSPVKKQLSLGAQVPADELRNISEKIEKSNEVVMRQSEWAVKSVDARVVGAEDATE